MKSADSQRLDPALVGALYAEHADELRYFLLGVLRDGDLAADVLQNTFAKAVEQGHTAQEETLKGWLFRVAFNEAMALRRRQGVRERGIRRLAANGPPPVEQPDEQLSRRELVGRVREALDELPAEQRRVVCLRVYDQKKFAAIAAELGLPLGTVLTRMQAGLKKLRKKLQTQEWGGDQEHHERG